MNDNKFAIDILWLNKTAQASNGLKHGDYRRYHLYCTRKLHRLRKALKWTQGRGRFVKRKIGEEEVVSKGGGRSDVRFLWLVLLQAERAWSHGMELKEEAALLQNSKKRMSTRRKRRWPLRKWTKAALWARHLERLCSSIGAPTKTILEAQAYAQLMAGNALLERKQWKASQESFQRAYYILEKLEQTKGTSAQQRHIYRQYIQEMEPSVRYCRYQLTKLQLEENSDNQALFVAELEGQLNRLESELQAKENGASILSVEWRGTRIPIANRRIQQCLQRIVEQENDRDENDITKLEKIISLYMQCIRLVSKEWEQLTITEMDKQIGEEFAMLKAYFVSNRVQLALRRNVLIWNNLESNHVVSWRQRIRLVEHCIKLCEEILQLKDFQNDAESNKYWSQRKQFFRAYRCFYLASYLSSRHMWTESYLSSKKALEDLKQISKEDLRDNWIQEHIDSLQEKITRQACLSKAYAFLDEIRLADKWNELKLDDSTCSVSFNAPLINRLHEIVLPNSFERLAKDWKMIDLQPSFMKVPCKPFLFDIASEELSFPDMSLFVNEGNKSVEDTNAKKGLLGRAVSWFSGKK
ncbi:signal recognition particle subunit SRP68 [Galdieria sulphuraria]|uniref:Signal recognition particle subunit SRP68 n=1 Tax=Galdieria sulphuraria TaxID=130081 RepID=M2XYA5_GALSU|nr:signal recognition particle subunit SRP68 [Galdieria sulphuraria]EME28434.1 signal recognition particle subunit SRP68 [Galdieria sulphuraria]|eukprot:XP_005704954.1 signal recognition particle subunit SRP68 [Galdieria sulphuraria]